MCSLSLQCHGLNKHFQIVNHRAKFDFSYSIYKHKFGTYQNPQAPDTPLVLTANLSNRSFSLCSRPGAYTRFTCANISISRLHWLSQLFWQWPCFGPSISRRQRLMEAIKSCTLIALAVLAFPLSLMDPIWAAAGLHLREHLLRQHKTLPSKLEQQRRHQGMGHGHCRNSVRKLAADCFTAVYAEIRKLNLACHSHYRCNLNSFREFWFYSWLKSY